MRKSPPPAPSPTQPSTPVVVSPYLRRRGSEASEQLRKTVRAILGDHFGAFLRALSAPPGKPDPREASHLLRARQELSFSVISGTQRWRDTFVEQVESHLIGDVAPHARAEDTEEDMGRATAELDAEERNQQAIAALDSRLDRIRETLYIPVYGKALAPAGLYRALQDTATAMALTPAQRRALFTRFDELMLTELPALYAALLESIDRIDIKAVEFAPPPLPPGLGRPAPAPAAGAAPRILPGSPAMPAGAPRIDNETVSMLRAQASSADPVSYNDGALALDILSLNEEKPVPGMADDKRWVPLQRITLAGMFLNAAITDPLVSDDLRPQQESMRFPLVKSALADSTLFTAVTHPLRSLVNELMMKSATSRITGNSEARRLAEMLQQVLVQFDLAPDFVREAMLAAKPIDEQQIQRFFELQKQQASERRAAVVAEAKRAVIGHIERCTFGRFMPQAAIRFLNSAWGPLMIKRLLQHGVDHPQWTLSLGLMEQMLDQLEAREAGASPPDWQRLVRTMSDALAAEGLAADRMAEAMSNLVAAWNTPPENNVL